MNAAGEISRRETSNRSARILGAGRNIPELDGVRGLAVWLVLVSHLVGGWGIAPFPKPVVSLLGHGWLGVDLFFVLSGFLITGILLDARDKPQYFRNFYARRFLRIIPLYFTVIALCWLAYPGYSRYFILSLFFLANFYYPFGVAYPHGPSVFWSLAVEEHFYLVWPWLVRFVKRPIITITALLLVAGVPLVRVWAVRVGFRNLDEIYVYSWTRCDALALGALLAVWVRSRWMNRRNSLRLAGALCGLCVILTVAGLPLGIMDNGSVWRYTQAQLLFGALVLWAVAQQGATSTAPLRWRFAILSGDLSYCLYLVHLSVGDAYQSVLIRKGVNPDSFAGPFGSFALRSIAVLVLSFALALLSRRFLEQPFLNLKRHFMYREKVEVGSLVAAPLSTNPGP